ncbi:MAG: xylose isomerase [Planctomycetaceae bacterium]|nr:xylose isomerase [Planctomycetaceae bacterium]
MNRRDFLSTTAAAAATGIAMPALSFADDKKSGARNKKPLYKISLAQWSLNRRFFKREEPHLGNLDFAKTARQFGIEAIEYVNQFFIDKAKDKKYLTEMKKRAASEGVESLLIMIDREGNLGDPDNVRRTKAVENHFKWVEAAKFLGCHSIRVNARSNAKLSYDDQMKLAADGLGRLTEFGAKHDINVIVENHGGLSSNGKWLAGVIKMVDNPRCGTLPDFGNFGIDRNKDEWYDRYLGVKELMPFAKAVSAKAHAFDSERPFVTVDKRHDKETDFLKMMRIVLDAGYRGWVGIESEGGQDQFQGVRDTKALLESVRDKLADEYT